MFVVRTAGHVIDSAVLGSIEYAVTVLDVPLIVVLGHDSCGAVKATSRRSTRAKVPAGSSVTWSNASPVDHARAAEGLTRVDEFEARHVVETGSQLLARSSAIAERIRDGELAIVGVTYHLADGRTVLREHLGDIGE